MNTSKCGNLIQMTNGYFQRWRTSYITHSLVLHFPRWRLRQISHPGDFQHVKFPTHVRFTGSNSRGLPPLPVLGQTIDRCISTPINGLPRMGGGGQPTGTGGWMMLTCFLSPFVLLKLVVRRRKLRKKIV